MITTQQFINLLTSLNSIQIKKVLGTDATDSLTELLTQFSKDEKTY